MKTFVHRVVNTLLHLQAAAVFDLESGRCMRQLEGHKGGVSGAAFSADGALVATCSADASLRVWRTATGAASLPPLPHVHAACEYSFFLCRCCRSTQSWRRQLCALLVTCRRQASRALFQLIILHMDFDVDTHPQVSWRRSSWRTPASPAAALQLSMANRWS